MKNKSKWVAGSGIGLMFVGIMSLRHAVKLFMELPPDFTLYDVVLIGILLGLFVFLAVVGRKRLKKSGVI